jgi:hypothetical protein
MVYSQPITRLQRAVIVAASLLLLSITALPAYAQAPIVSATVDSANLSSNEPLTLSITVAANGAYGQPHLPALDGFRILETSSGTRVSSVNGNTTVQTITQYSLLPLRAGDLTIPAIAVAVDGQIYQTDPIQVTVSQAAAPLATTPAGSSSLPPLFQSGSDPLDLFGMLDQLMQQSPNLSAPLLRGLSQLPISPSQSSEQIAAPAALQGQDYYAEALIDKPTAYQGEQVLYTVRLYQALNPFGQIEYQPPAFSGFWSKQLPDQKTYMAEASGRAYRVTELQHVLFPTVAGEVAIDPARLTMPGDFLGARGVEIASQPLALDVQPLPAGAPASFQGAVGQYQIETSVDKAAAKVGDAITQRVTISGAGNIEQVTDPAWPDDVAWRAFDSQATTESQFREGLLAGVRQIERVLVPTQAGDLALTSPEFSFFDPTAGQYRTVSAEPAVVAVAPDSSATTSMAQAAPAPSQQGMPRTAAALPSLRPLKAVAAQSLTAGAALPQQPIYWALWALPAALVAGQLVWQRQQRHGQVNAAALRSRRAAKQASHALRAAAKQPQTVPEAAGRILAEYLSAKLQRPVTGLTQNALAEGLLARSVDPALIARVQTILAQSEIGRYAPVGYAGEASDLLARTQQVIDDLERQLEP